MDAVAIRAVALEEAAKALEAEGDRLHSLEGQSHSLLAEKCYDNATMLRKLLGQEAGAVPALDMRHAVYGQSLLQWNRSLGDKAPIAIGKELFVARKARELAAHQGLVEADDAPEFMAPACWCSQCQEDARNRQMLTSLQFTSLNFIVCPDCGNKRCPKASHHQNICTGSNNLGQIGSYTGR